METKSLENFLKQFGQKVMDDAKLKLANSKDSMGNARGDTALGQSIRFEVVPTDTGFSTQFYMATTWLQLFTDLNKKQTKCQ